MDTSDIRRIKLPCSTYELPVNLYVLEPTSNSYQEKNYDLDFLDNSILLKDGEYLSMHYDSLKFASQRETPWEWLQTLPIKWIRVCDLHNSIPLCNYFQLLRFSKLEKLHLRAPCFPEFFFPRFKEKESLQSIKIFGSKNLDKTVRELGGSALSALTISGTDFTNKGAQYLLDLPNLTKLDCTDTKLSSLKTIGKCSKLQQLAIGSWRDHQDTNDLHIGDLSGLHSLANLSVSANGGLDKTNVHCLAHLPKLETLNIMDAQFTDDCAKQLLYLEQVSSIKIGSNALTSKGTFFLEALQKLSAVGLYGTQLTDDALKPLPKLNNLKMFCMGRFQLSQAGMLYLAQSTKLEMIEVKYKGDYEKCFSSIVGLPLKSLTLKSVTAGLEIDTIVNSSLGNIELQQLDVLTKIKTLENLVIFCATREDEYYLTNYLSSTFPETTKFMVIQS